MNKIEEIASVHLGKAGDGSVVKPYITPDQVDPTLLVPIPRQLNRDHYGINYNTKMEGYDTWNAYEVSFLLDNGYPVNVIAKIIYSSESPYIVESKSLKLYLNSFNMQKSGKTMHEATDAVAAKIHVALSNLLATDVSVDLFTDNYFSDVPGEFAFRGTFPSLENILDIEEMEFPFYNENPDILQIDHVSEHNIFTAKSHALRSNCRVTNQPDWGDVYIAMEGETLPTYESVLQYIVSMRKENHFHEEICECIYKRLLDKFDPTHLMVGCLYTRRGGIDINPVRATSIDVLLRYSKALMTPGILVNKTMRQ